jgi:hypothetical protein
VTFKVRDGKEYLIQQTTAIFNAYSKDVIGTVPSKNSQLTMCRSLSLLPAMVLALIKSVCILADSLQTIYAQNAHNAIDNRKHLMIQEQYQSTCRISRDCY